jgi:hypothetical protein
MSARVMSVVGVAESVVEREIPSPSTSTLCTVGASWSAMCTTGLVPETTLSGCSTVAKPGAVIFSR